MSASVLGFRMHPRTRFYVYSGYVELFQKRNGYFNPNDTMPLPLHGISPSIVTYALLTRLHYVVSFGTHKASNNAVAPSSPDEDNRAPIWTRKKTSRFPRVGVATNRNTKCRSYEVSTSLQPTGVPCQLMGSLWRHISMSERHKKQKQGTGKSLLKLFSCISYLLSHPAPLTFYCHPLPSHIVVGRLITSSEK